jgi:ribosomal protein S18 acetylase RimI-like enzyme
MEIEAIKIQEFQPAHQPYFEQLYLNWFSKHFRMSAEPIDKFVLAHPEKAILEKGGAILVVSYEDRTAGFVALKKTENYCYELTKMVIVEEYRGAGLGEALCRSAIRKARSMGAKRIILYSHSSLQPAIHMYRKLGFKEVLLEPGTYSSFRCDIKMELWLDAVEIVG